MKDMFRYIPSIEGLYNIEGLVDKAMEDKNVGIYEIVETTESQKVNQPKEEIKEVEFDM